MKKPSLAAIKTVRQAFWGLHDGVPNQLDVTRANLETLNRMRHIPPGGNWKDLPEVLRTKGCQSNLYRRLLWDEPSITIVNPRKAMILHPEENRIISVREACDLFDIPRDYEIKGKTLGSRQQQVCNAVPISLTRAAAKVIRERLDEYLLPGKGIVPFTGQMDPIW